MQMADKSPLSPHVPPPFIEGAMVGGLNGKKRTSSTWMRDIKFPEERISTLLLFHPDVYLQQPLLHILTNHCFCSPVRREIILCIQLKLEIKLYFREQKSKQDVVTPGHRTVFYFGFPVPFSLIACISKRFAFVQSTR